MPMYQAQLNRTAFRSFAPAAGVYDGPPQPRPPPCAPPPPAPAPRPPWAGAAPGAWALDRDGTPIMRVATIAPRVHIILFREAIVISRYRVLVPVAGGDIGHASVRRVTDSRNPNGL